MSDHSMFPDARITTVTLLTLFVSSACSSYDSVEPVPPVLATLTVTLAAPVIEVGKTALATAAGFDQNGAPMVAGPVRWTSSDPTIAEVEPATGTIRAIATGTARITATTAGRRTASQIITVIPVAARVAREVDPTRALLRVGFGRALVVTTTGDVSTSRR